MIEGFLHLRYAADPDLLNYFILLSDALFTILNEPVSEEVSIPPYLPGFRC